MRDAELGCSSTFFCVAERAELMCAADVPNHHLARVQSANVHLPLPFQEDRFNAANELPLAAAAVPPFTADVILGQIKTEAYASLHAELATGEVRGDADRIRELEHENARLKAKNEQQRLLMGELGHR